MITKIILGLLAVSIFVLLSLVIAFWQGDQSVEVLKAKWAKPPSEFIEIKGMQIHLRDEGPKDDPSPILLLHGTGASLHTWNGWSKELEATRRVIRFDMPGFGLTGPHPQNIYTIDEYVSVVIEVLDKLKIDSVIIAGNSLGGYISWSAVVLHPERFSHLILIDSSGYPFEAESIPLGFRLAQTPILNKLMEKILPRSVIDSSIKNVYGDPSLVTDVLVDRYFDLTTRTGNREALKYRFEQMQAGERLDQLANITIPTLIIWGRKDRLIPVELAYKFEQTIPRNELIIFDELGHVPQEEDPKKTYSVFLRFLDMN